MNQSTPPWSTGPPPVYDYPADSAPRSPWLAIVAIVGVCVAVIVVVIAATMIVVRKSEPTVVSIASPAPVTSVSTVTTPIPVLVPVPAPRATVTASAPPQAVPPPQPVSSCSLLRNQANTDNSVTRVQVTGYWVPQLSSKQPGLVADGITWDCDSIWSEHVQLRLAYNANLMWSGDFPHTYGHDDYWVSYAAYTFDNAEGARQWCRDQNRDSDHCYPTQIR